jgi:diguanylate cyclase
MGGDEFCALFAGATPVQAAKFMERVRYQFEASAFGSYPAGLFGATASFGIAGFDTAMNSADLIEAADRALYAAKQEGRNLVSLQSDENQKSCLALMQVLDRRNGGRTALDAASCEPVGRPKP